MKMMVMGHWGRTTLQEIGSKFASGEDVSPPENTELLARWHDPASRLVWIVVDTPDSLTIQNWMVRWSDYIDWDIYSVVDDDEVGALLEEVLS